MFSSAWGFHAEPVLHAYMVMVRPGSVKGWVKHLAQDDRQFPIVGALLYVLYDDRPESPTYKMVQRLTFGDRRRGLLVIPAGVYHAVQNVGPGEAFLVNLPTRPYDHASPDKYRLPIHNDVIPYSFERIVGW